jgi:CotH kinase protein/PKD domain/Secretion system C-terminal sorting domain/Proprotein convertase P-domain
MFYRKPIASLFLLTFFISNFLYAQTFMGLGDTIPDDGTTIYFDLPVNLTVNSLDTFNFGIESVCINATHTWNSDLSLFLRAPDGTSIQLFSSIGGDSDGFTGTCLSGNTNVSIFSAGFPFTGTFRPFGDMGLLNNGLNPNGTWQLVILDIYAFADTGVLFDWSITFGSMPCRPFPFESSDLPIVQVNTDGQYIPNDPKILSTLRIIDNGMGQRNYPNQANVAYEGPIGIELRGNSSQSFPKKSYTFETWDVDGNDQPVSLLGLPATTDFILGANFTDKTLMRNALTFDLTRQLGHYASRTRFCELIIDGGYQGVYVLTEKIKRGSERLDIAKLTPSDTIGENLTGGYLLKMDWNTSDGWYSPFYFPNTTDFTAYFQHEYPKPANLHPKQQAYIRSYIDSFEVALKGNAFQNPTTGWRRFADETTFLDYLFLNELSKNVDGYRLSTFFYKDKGEKLKMGPPWDYDLAWNNADYCENALVSGWGFNFNEVCAPNSSPGYVPFWWKRLMSDALFKQNAACHWQNLRLTDLSKDSIFAKIDSMASVILEAKERNFKLWPILGIYVWPNPEPIPTDYPGEIAKLKLWITNRLAWLDNAFGQTSPEPNINFTFQELGGMKWQFQASNAPNLTSFLWDFGDGTTSTEVAPVHTFSSIGNFNVKLNVTSQYGCNGETVKNFSVLSTFSKDKASNKLVISPNPSIDVAYISLNEKINIDCKIQLINTLGEIMVQKSTSFKEGKTSLEIATLPAGIYIVQVRCEQNIWIGQLEKI